MSKINFDNTKNDGFFAKKGFYIALATCLVAIGAATWTAINTFSSLGNDTTLEVPSASLSAEPDTSSAYNFYSRSSEVYLETSSEDSSDEEDVSEPSSEIEESSESDTAAEPAQTTPEQKEPAVTYVLPIKGTIIKNYSEKELQYSKTYNDWRIHQGIDIAAELGSEVVAIAGGIVKEVYSDPLWGTTIVIEHKNGIVSYYSGLDSETNVTAGQEVSTSQKIGKSGVIPCESADGIHLHLGIKKDGKWTAPLETMGLDNN